MNFVPVAPGVWKIRLGTPEPNSPVDLRRTSPATQAMRELGDSAECPIDAADVRGSHSPRGYHAALPLEPAEQIYGLGLQLKSVAQRGKKKTLRVNSDPIADLGDSHAPVPFYVSTAGYGVLIDTARYATFYFGAIQPADRGTPTPRRFREGPGLGTGGGQGEVLATDDADRPTYHGQQSDTIDVDIPTAAGVDVYVFAGPSMLDAVRRYNLFGGGGPVVPRWGLGVWYRPLGQMGADDVVALASELRESKMPCDVIGLEPGWQSRSYSCTFVWSDKFPEPAAFVKQLRAQDFQVNLWTHAFTHPESPAYEKLLPYSGDYQVWNGLVPDFTITEAREAFAAVHDRLHVDIGVSGYKLDECDDSDFIGRPWSFPQLSKFPSGLDGEQYHSLFGTHYQATLGGIFQKRGVRTYGLARNAHALASSYPFVLYSDLYEHADFIRGVVNCGFSGLLWTPEVRHAVSDDDLIRRLQAVVFSPMALVNAWYITLPPWKQWRTAQNNEGKLHENHDQMQDRCREILNLRMQFLPYLYAAFVDYHVKGTPPFRAMVMDYPGDPAVYAIDDQYMMGDRVLVAPITADQNGRDVYLPEGAWRDFWTGELLAGGQSHKAAADIDRIPVYVKDGSLLPLATPTQHVEDPAARELMVRVYGDGNLPCTLYEDDGVTLEAARTGEWNPVTLEWNASAEHLSVLRSVSPMDDSEAYRYMVVGLEPVPPAPNLPRG